jgi:hypothetical protein
LKEIALDYEKLKIEIKAIAEIANGVPQAFQERCFEVLLQHLLAGGGSPRDDPPPDEENNGGGPGGSATIPQPSQVKVFLNKTKLSMDDLAKVVMWEDQQVHFLKEPTTNKIARGQIEWSLLLGLKSGIESNSFSVDPESVRSICQEKGFYDAANFSKNFKSAKNAALFQGEMDSQGESQRLSSDGQEALAKLIKSLSSDS